MLLGTALKKTALLAAAAIFFASNSFADVHIVRVNEFATQCDDGSTNIQYIELRVYAAGQFFRAAPRR